MKILAGNSSQLLARQISSIVGIPYVKAKTTYFQDKEIKIDILEDLGQEDVIIVHSTSKPVNDNLLELLLLIDNAKNAKAKKIIAVIPYFGYSRQNRTFNNKNSIPARLIANLLEQAGVTSIITIDLHSDNIEKFFTIPIYNLDPTNLYLPFLDNYNNFIIVSPDKGAISRAEKLSNLSSADIAIIQKQRDSNDICSMNRLSGQVAGKHCIIVDDIIDSGETTYKTTQFLFKNGALSVSAFITHAVLSGNLQKNITNSALSKIFVTDTIKSIDLPPEFQLISVAPIIAQLIQKIM